MERFWEQKIEFNVQVICLEFKKYKMTKEGEKNGTDGSVNGILFPL